MIESGYLEDNQRLIESLKRIPNLKPFSEEELASLVRISKIQKYQKGETIVEQGSYDTLIYFIMYGQVRIERNGKPLTVLKRRGDIFGEMGALDGSASSATVTALNEVVCLATDTGYIESLSSGDKQTFCYILYRIYAEVLSKRLRMASDEIIRLKRSGVSGTMKLSNPAAASPACCPPDGPWESLPRHSCLKCFLDHPIDLFGKRP